MFWSKLCLGVLEKFFLELGKEFRNFGLLEVGCGFQYYLSGCLGFSYGYYSKKFFLSVIYGMLRIIQKKRVYVWKIFI